MHKSKKIRIIRYWNIKLANYVYGFEVINDEGKTKSQHLLDCDRNWAERTANYFKIEVPDEEDLT